MKYKRKKKKTMVVRVMYKKMKIKKIFLQKDLNSDLTINIIS